MNWFASNAAYWIFSIIQSEQLFNTSSAFITSSSLATMSMHKKFAGDPKIYLHVLIEVKARELDTVQIL